MKRDRKKQIGGVVKDCNFIPSTFAFWGGVKGRVEGEKMGLLTNRVDRSEIKPGDHIYTYRAVFAYSHHGNFQCLLPNHS
ncbi:hypothetical protein MTR67_004984 [Solanum verrucosum]|uniref:Uncharacterized protein n=1 Tax=Solanum verrucosum TaxID=315347 RepID=A0AAF0Q163_SOLVR|nr:hypothetical protein MTR67_004984 [Solanum verrucosum]